MTRFRKRPVEIEAVRFMAWVEGASPPAPNFDVGSDPMPPDWLTEAVLNGVIYTLSDTKLSPAELRVHTLEGVLSVPVGHWIVRGIKGELYPCDPEIFDELHTPVATELPLAKVDDRRGSWDEQPV